MLLPVTIAGIAGYLLGSLPFGYFVARAYGVNIFEVGSKNPGATNVRRVLGKRPGSIVLACDILKGMFATVLPVLVAWIVRPSGDPAAAWEFAVGGTRLFGAEDIRTMQVAGLVGSLLGHSFSCFTGFRGGKGVATGAGSFLVLVPMTGLLIAVVWVATFYTTRYVSLASIMGAVAVPVVAWLLGEPPLIVGLGALIGGFVIFRHRENVGRLMKGTENKFVRKPKDGEPKAG